MRGEGADTADGRETVGRGERLACRARRERDDNNKTRQQSRVSYLYWGGELARGGDHSAAGGDHAGSGRGSRKAHRGGRRRRISADSLSPPGSIVCCYTASVNIWAPSAVNGPPVKIPPSLTNGQVSSCVRASVQSIFGRTAERESGERVTNGRERGAGGGDKDVGLHRRD